VQGENRNIFSLLILPPSIILVIDNVSPSTQSFDKISIKKKKDEIVTNEISFLYHDDH
jgi:hypothetical protein